MIRLVALDLDGTLLADDKSICRKNVETIRKAQKAGIRIVLCSGRAQKSLEELMGQLGLCVPGEYGIGLNGAVIFEACSDWRAVHHMAPETAEKLIRMGEKHQDEVNLQLYNEDSVFVQRWDRTSDFYTSVTHKRPTVVKDLREQRECTSKVCFFTEDPECLSSAAPLDRILELKNRLEDEKPEGISACISAPYLLEYMDDSVNKAYGMQKLGEKLGILREEMMAVGDLENDLSMLEYAGIGVAMKNGSAQVKASADHVTELDNNEGGVAEAIEKFCF